MNKDVTDNKFFSMLEEGMAESAEDLKDCFLFAAEQSSSNEEKKKFECACSLIERTRLCNTNASEHQELDEALRIAVEYIDERSAYLWRGLWVNFAQCFREFEDKGAERWEPSELKKRFQNLILELEKEFVKLEIFPRVTLSFYGRTVGDGERVVMYQRRDFFMMNESRPRKYYRISATRSNGEVIHQISDGNKWKVGVSTEEADAHLQSTGKHRELGYA